MGHTALNIWALRTKNRGVKMIGLLLYSVSDLDEYNAVVATVSIPQYA